MCSLSPRFIPPYVERNEEKKCFPFSSQDSIPNFPPPPTGIYFQQVRIAPPCFLPPPPPDGNLFSYTSPIPPLSFSPQWLALPLYCSFVGRPHMLHFFRHGVLFWALLDELCLTPSGFFSLITPFRPYPTP